MSFRQLILAAGLLSSLALQGCLKEQGDFQHLKAIRNDSQAARPIASRLKDSPRGVQLAVADIDCFGGTTGGWSSWILQNSGLNNQVERALNGLANSPDERLARRIEAARVLWLRTHRADPINLWFDLIQKGGAPVVGLGRRLLISTLDFGDAGTLIAVPPDKDCALTKQEFLKILKDKGLLKSNF